VSSTDPTDPTDPTSPAHPDALGLTPDTTYYAARFGGPEWIPAGSLNGPAEAPTLAPSTRQVLARTRRAIDILATSATPVPMGPDCRATVESAVDRTIDAERLDPYMRSGRGAVFGNTLEYVWSWWPLAARSVSRDVRAGAAQLETFADRATRASGAEEALAAAALQGALSPRDPRITWQLQSGALVMDEVATNFHPSGLVDAYMTRRVRADLALGRLLANRAGVDFLGVRLIPLKRPLGEGLLAFGDTPRGLLTQPLADSPLAVVGVEMTAGVW
jgi:hypothetical protein